MTAAVLSSTDVAAMLQCRPSTVSVLARRGDLKSFFIGDGRLRRFDASDVEAYIAERRGLVTVA